MYQTIDRQLFETSMDTNAQHLIEFESMAALIEAPGVVAVCALAIKSPLTIYELARVIKRSVRNAKEILLRVSYYGYVGEGGPLDQTVWHITDKARDIIAAVFAHLLPRGSDPRQLPLPGSDPVSAGSDPASVATSAPSVCAPRAQPIIHSDQIIDQNSEFSESEIEMNETPDAPRDRPAVSAALDRQHIRDLPGKPNRTALLADAWVTPARIDAAIARAQANPYRKSPSPIGLAVAELMKHAPEIDAWLEAHQPEGIIQDDNPPISAQAPRPAVDRSIESLWQSVKSEISLEMTRATFDAWLKNADVIGVEHEENKSVLKIAVPNAYSKEWIETRLVSTIERILLGISHLPYTIRLVVWSKDNVAN